MFWAFGLLGFLASCDAMAHEIIRDRGKARCGNPGRIEAHIESGKHTQSQKEAFRASGGFARIQTSSLAVDLYIHVIAGSTSQSDGYLTVGTAEVCYFCL